MDRTLVSFRARNADAMKVLNQILTVGLTTDEAQYLFYDIKDSLISLFEDENRIVHTRVLELTKGDMYLSKTVNFFLSEVNKCYQSFREFIARYPQPSSGLHYAEEFGIVYAALLQRVRMEEHAIYGIYDEQLMKSESMKLAKIA